jgi:hypothetical protein
MIMAKQGVDDDEAFDILWGASQRMDVRLREMNERISTRRPRKPVERADSTTRLEDNAK